MEDNTMTLSARPWELHDTRRVRVELRSDCGKELKAEAKSKAGN